MKTAVWTALVLILFAGLLHAQPAAPPPVQDASSGVLAYVPPDADLAVLVRMDALVKTDLWQRLRDLDIHKKFAEEFHLALDIEKDVAAGVFCLQILYDEGGEPDDALLGIVLALARCISWLCWSSVRVLVAGLVIIRQRPPSAQGYVFLTLEDEGGLINLIVRPGVYERYRSVLRNAPLLIASGRLQREGLVSSVLVYQAVPL